MGTWHSSVINLLISVQNELVSGANSLSKTWVKYFYVFALARLLRPTAQWTISLSDTNNPPTLGSAARLRRCQDCWVYVLRGDPSNTRLAFWLRTERWSLWSTLLTTTLPSSRSGAKGRTNSGGAAPSGGLSTGSGTEYSWRWGPHALVNYRLLFFHQSTLGEFKCQHRNANWKRVKSVTEGVIICRSQRCWDFTWTAAPVHRSRVSYCTLSLPIPCHSTHLSLSLCLSPPVCSAMPGFFSCLSECLSFNSPCPLTCHSILIVRLYMQPIPWHETPSSPAKGLDPAFCFKCVACALFPGW